MLKGWICGWHALNPVVFQAAGNQLLADEDGRWELTAALQRLCLLDWLTGRCHPERLTVSETDSGIRVERRVVSLGFFQNHGHQDVLKSRLVILDLPMADAF